VPGVEAPSTHATGARRGPGGASIESSSALRFPTAAFSSACRACGMASDVRCRGSARPAPTFRSNPPGETVRPRGHGRLVKDDRFCETRTPSLDECSLPRSDPPRAHGLRRGLDTLGRGFRLCPPIGEDRGCGIFESSPPCSWFCHREPASDVPSPPEHEAGWLDPHAVKRSDQTSLVDFCNQNNPRAQPRDRPIPGSDVVGAAGPACAGLEGDLPDGVEAPSATPTAESGQRHGFDLPAILADR